MTKDEEMRRFACMVAEELERWKREPQFLNEADAAKLVGLTPRSLQQMRYDGSGPPFVKLSEGPRADPLWPCGPAPVDQHAQAILLHPRGAGGRRTAIAQ